jgi:N-glycosylase/DNA lyase
VAERLELELVGAGGEPVDLWRTLVSHGVAALPPANIDEEARTLETTLDAGGPAARTLVLAQGRDGYGRLELRGRRPGARERAEIVAIVRHMLRLDEDLSRFYALIAGDDELAWAARGAGRMLRSPTVFEDVVKTICTTNCTWSATERMVGALVDGLGPDGRAFPTPAAMAEAGDAFYRDVARTGYRGPYLRSVAASVAAGDVDLEELDGRSDLPDDEVAKRLLALPGIGPYAAAHVMMLLGRYGRLILDAWTRPKYARLRGRKRVADSTIERRYRRYREFAGLAFWLYLTRDWVVE